MMNEYETACKEWIKSCTCAAPDKPWECSECTKAFYNKILKLAVKDGYGQVGSNTLFELYDLTTDTPYYYRAVALDGSITPVKRFKNDDEQ